MADGEKQPIQAKEQVEPMAPGSVVQPGAPPPTVPVPTPVQTPSSAPQPQQEPIQAPTVPAAAPSPPPTPPHEEQIHTDSQFKDEGDTISWTASEFIAHDKSAGWYMALGLVAVIISVIDYLLTKDFVSVGVVVGAALIMAIYASHKPRQVRYSLDYDGIIVGQKSFDYTEFKTFSVMPEGAFASIVFTPLKRFMLPLTIYYDPADEDKILDLLVQYLPFEQKRPDALESLMRRIRF